MHENRCVQELGIGLIASSPFSGMAALCGYGVLTARPGHQGQREAQGCGVDQHSDAEYLGHIAFRVVNASPSAGGRWLLMPALKDWHGSRVPPQSVSEGGTRSWQRRASS